MFVNEIQASRLQFIFVQNFILNSLCFSLSKWPCGTWTKCNSWTNGKWKDHVSNMLLIIFHSYCVNTLVLEYWLPKFLIFFCENSH